MSLHKRIVQLGVVAGLATAGILTTQNHAVAMGTQYCANSCSAMGVCDAAGGGDCTMEPCLGVDGHWYDYVLTCKADA